jgi:hypothetical protein
MIPTIKSEVPISNKMKSGLNKKDFIFAKETDKVLKKEPGQINGQGFQIDSLTKCMVYLMDYSTQVQLTRDE